MTTIAKTTWLSPARQITRQDHLAVLAVSQHLFAELFPASRTSRSACACARSTRGLSGRCDRHVAKMTPSQVVELVLRAEVLVEFVDIAHELETGGKRDHGAGLVGRDVLVGVAKRVRAGEAVSLPTDTSQTS